MNIINLLILLTLILSVYFLIYYKTQSQNTQSSLIKSSLNPNEYYPTLIDDTNNNRSLFTDPLDLNYNISTGTLFAKNISANFNGTSSSAFDLEKNGSGNLLLQINSTNTSLLPNGNEGQVLVSQLNDSPIWIIPPIPTSKYIFPNAVFFGTGTSDKTYSSLTDTGESKYLFFKNFTVNSNDIYSLNGSKLFVSGTLRLDGIIRNNGDNAIGSNGGKSAKCYPGDTRNIKGTNASLSYINLTPPNALEIQNTFKNGSGLEYFGGGNGGYIMFPSYKGDGGYARILYNIQSYLTQPIITSLSMYNNNEGIVNVNGGAPGGCGESINGIGGIGGGGGGGGGVVHICANEIILGSNAKIEAKGGKGGNSGLGGGGGGGGGGLIFIVTRSIKNSDGSQISLDNLSKKLSVLPGTGGDGQTNLIVTSRTQNSKGKYGQFGRIVIIYL